MRVFTLKEARDLLVKIKPIAEDIRHKKEELRNLYEELNAQEDELEQMYVKTRIKELEAQIKRHLARIEELGGVIKGLDPLLVDFLSEHNGRYIWLCWKEDEETIMYWHELNEGFAGRRPVEELEESETLF
ncbi:DUF2203 domain-containing protein [Aquifex aeolicus]|uniref:DUF2203 family protein n=1 Tax=Aquifex aeolicus (strain VF5) TaxID=224324 RepID=O67666_AQUAE|nr:DUF2203 family protein [Aquifex aeolicus]AAC07630.1 hypothetical protein aq_1797 [Aquifex aeolicus VF5]